MQFSDSPNVAILSRPHECPEIFGLHIDSAQFMKKRHRRFGKDRLTVTENPVHIEKHGRYHVKRLLPPDILMYPAEKRLIFRACTP